MSVVAGIVQERLAGMGCPVEAVGEGRRQSLTGLLNWCVTCIDTSSVSEAIETLRQLVAVNDRRSIFSAVGIRYKLGLRMLVLHEELRQAAREIVRCLPGNAVAASASRVLARAEGWTKTVHCDRRLCCVVPLDDWLTLAYAWRMAMLPRRNAAPLPRAEGTRIGNWIAHDYDAVRHAQVEEETTEQIRRGGKPLWSSVMGFSGSPVDESMVDSPSAMGGGGERRRRRGYGRTGKGRDGD